MNLKYRLKALMDSEYDIIRVPMRFLYRITIQNPITFYLRYRPGMDDRTYIERLYQKRFGVKPNLDNPENFNEKNNWRKLYDRRPEYTDMVDKLRFKNVVAARAGEIYTIPLLGAWKSPDEIDYQALPDQFVLKTNHAGGIIVCRDKDTFDKKEAAKEITHMLKTDYFMISREWPYKNVKRMIIAEQYMGENLTDFKNYCFNGKLMYTFVWKNHSRSDGRKPDPVFCGAYDREWLREDIQIGYPSSEELVQKPDCYDEMVQLAEKLSAGIPFVRVDCYIINGKLYAGEMTFFPWGGFLDFKNQEWNIKLGEMEQLPVDGIITNSQQL